MTSKHIEKMEHCLGLNRAKEPYRNYYGSSQDDTEWKDLIDKGYAEQGNRVYTGGMVSFWLTKKGVEFILGRSISNREYNEL